MRRPTALLLVLLTGTALLHGASLRGGFVWDDQILVAQKAALFGRAGAARAVLASPDAGLYTSPTPYYRPLTTLTLLADRRLWGDDPRPYHAENLLLHLAATGLLFALLHAAFQDVLLAFLAAVLFAAHPVTVEAVAPVFNRNAPLCGALLLLSLSSLLRGGAAWTALSLAAYAAALLSKETAAALPLFLLAFAWVRSRGLAGRHGAAAGFLALTAGWLLLRKAVLGAALPAAQAAPSPLLVLSSSAEALRLMLFPLHLNAMLTLETLAPSLPKAAAGLAALAALSWLAFRRASPHSLSAGALWLLCALLPVSNLLPIPSAPMAERYLYLPVMGAALMAAWALRELCSRRAALGAAAVLALAGLFALRTLSRVPVWRDDESLFLGMAASDPRNAWARYNLGSLRVEAGRLDEARAEWEETVRIDPGHAGAHVGLGNLSALSGDLPSAVVRYRRALELGAKDPGVLYNLALVEDEAGDRRSARRDYALFIERAAVSRDPAMREKVEAARGRLRAPTRD